MTLRVFDFVCSNGHKHELFVPSNIWDMPCPTCGLNARRIISAPRVKLEGFSGSFPGAAAAWEQRRESHMKWEKKQMDANGEVPGSPLPTFTQTTYEAHRPSERRNDENAGSTPSTAK
jgi:hypothetical protein